MLMLVCLNCGTKIKVPYTCVELICPKCNCMSLVAEETSWLQQHLDQISEEFSIDSAELIYTPPVHFNCKSQFIPDSLHQVRSEADFDAELSFDDLEENELASIAVVSHEEGINNPAIIVEMQDRFLHTFLNEYN